MLYSQKTLQSLIFFDKDNYFVNGIKLLLDEIIGRNNEIKEDVFFLSFQQGDVSLCNAELCGRKNIKIIIVLGKLCIIPDKIPSCYDDALLIYKDIKLSEARVKLRQFFNEKPRRQACNNSCKACSRVEFSKTELSMLQCFHSQLTFRETSGVLGLDIKTCYAYKDKIMKKLLLHSNKELLCLLRRHSNLLIGEKSISKI